MLLCNCMHTLLLGNFVHTLIQASSSCHATIARPITLLPCNSYRTHHPVAIQPLPQPSPCCHATIATSLSCAMQLLPHHKIHLTIAFCIQTHLLCKLLIPWAQLSSSVTAIVEGILPAPLPSWCSLIALLLCATLVHIHQPPMLPFTSVAYLLFYAHRCWLTLPLPDPGSLPHPCAFTFSCSHFSAYPFAHECLPPRHEIYVCPSMQAQELTRLPLPLTVVPTALSALQPPFLRPDAFRAPGRNLHPSSSQSQSLLSLWIFEVRGPCLGGGGGVQGDACAKHVQDAHASCSTCGWKSCLLGNKCVCKVCALVQGMLFGGGVVEGGKYAKLHPSHTSRGRTFSLGSPCVQMHVCRSCCPPDVCTQVPASTRWGLCIPDSPCDSMKGASLHLHEATFALKQAWELTEHET